MVEKKLTLTKADEVVIRMYGQGFGDCFLLAFPRLKAGEQTPDLKDPVYVVIDSGVYHTTPGRSERLRQVARSIHAATGGTIDLLVATHEHYDHLSGFEEAKEEWKKIGVRCIWLGWTEDKDHPATQRYDREKNALQLQAEIALEVAARSTMRDPALAAGLSRMLAVLEFGEDATVFQAAKPLPKPSNNELEPPDRLSKTPDRVLDDFTNAPGARFAANGPQTERHFLEPGQVWGVPGTQVDAYVLGPPTAQGRLVQDMVESEVYSKDEEMDGAGDAGGRHDLAQQLQLAAASAKSERATLYTALLRHLHGVQDDKDFVDANAPFARTMSLSLAEARTHAFFRDHYFRSRQDRRIDTDWLHGFSQLALQVDKVINNTSLVLAFRLVDGRVLLFVGDAQVGNWLSWFEIKPEEWRRPEGGVVNSRPSAEQLLRQTVVYKVGHHGSHNATLKHRGVEMMQDGLIAFVPSSRFFPQKGQNWTIPLPSLMKALWRKSGGQIVFPHEDLKANGPHIPQNELLEHSYDNSQFAQRVESADERFAPMVGEEITEESVPIWRQVRI